MSIGRNIQHPLIQYFTLEWATRTSRTRHPFSHRWQHWTFLCHLPRPSQEQKSAFAGILGDIHRLSECLPFIKIGSLENLSVHGRPHTHTWAKHLSHQLATSKAKPVTSAQSIANDLRREHTHYPLTGEIYGRPMLAKSTFYNWLQVSLEKSVIAGT